LKVLQPDYIKHCCGVWWLSGSRLACQHHRVIVSFTRWRHRGCL